MIVSQAPRERNSSRRQQQDGGRDGREEEQRTHPHTPSCAIRPSTRMLNEPADDDRHHQQNHQKPPPPPPPKPSAASGSVQLDEASRHEFAEQNRQQKATARGRRTRETREWRSCDVIVPRRWKHSRRVRPWPKCPPVRGHTLFETCSLRHSLIPFARETTAQAQPVAACWR